MLSQGLCPRGMSLNMFLELGSKERVVDLKRTRVNTQEDTGDIVLLKLPIGQGRLCLARLGLVRFFHISPYPRKGKEG